MLGTYVIIMEGLSVEIACINPRHAILNIINSGAICPDPGIFKEVSLYESFTSIEVTGFLENFVDCVILLTGKRNRDLMG